MIPYMHTFLLQMSLCCFSKSLFVPYCIKEKSHYHTDEREFVDNNLSFFLYKYICKGNICIRSS